MLLSSLYISSLSIYQIICQKKTDTPLTATLAAVVPVLSQKRRLKVMFAWLTVFQVFRFTNTHPRVLQIPSPLILVRMVVVRMSAPQKTAIRPQLQTVLRKFIHTHVGNNVHVICIHNWIIEHLIQVLFWEILYSKLRYKIAQVFFF